MSDSQEKAHSIETSGLRRRDRPGDLGRKASILTWLAIALGLVGVYLARRTVRQPLPDTNSIILVALVAIVAVLLAFWFLRTDFKAQKTKRVGLLLTALFFAGTFGFAVYSVAYWWVDRHGQPVDVMYQLVSKQATSLEWKPMQPGAAPGIRLDHPEPLFMSFAPGSQYPFPLLKGPMGFWVLNSDPDVDDSVTQ